MYSTSELYNKHIYVTDKRGEPKKYGRLRGVVFHPHKLRALGVMVKRPDVALMVKRKDRFAALDCIEFREEDLRVRPVEGAWDVAACKRLGVELDACVIWELMPVHTEGGRELGTVRSVSFGGPEFEIDHIGIAQSAGARTLLGALDIARADIVGYRGGAIVVKERVKDAEETGGVAAAAGKTWAKAKHAGKRVAKDAGEATDAAAYKVGEQVGRAKGMFRNFKDAYDKARHGE